MRVLLVDDDLFAAELASVFLEMSGYEVILAESAMTALANIDSDDGIDLVISDFHMPEITGLDLLEVLRANGWKKPFILLSASEMTDITIIPDCWVKKDENMAERLVAVVNELLKPDAAVEQI
ncbi:response regulator [Buttiauxella noackiae]|jgi:CheY-like chemotaxis protein|uniref:CheY-like receiver/winged-helix DNA-binding domain response regulator n=1 Tax=Buttiauxella noackiae ATCC 51607 TaxID=1354255 RepID=A0A1B7HLM2_9ENTR|nr:response regulator [Buttiauxella noackiae]MCA1923773.1 response regulator [Buttiauxella noackiae]OAT16509.1 CheY-like receiver/winged-helix DNA-binding domain response regulator [Buttiauxella noackiae ATCC 51607]